MKPFIQKHKKALVITTSVVLLQLVFGFASNQIKAYCREFSDHLQP